VETWVQSFSIARKWPAIF